MIVSIWSLLGTPKDLDVDLSMWICQYGFEADELYLQQISGAIRPTAPLTTPTRHISYDAAIQRLSSTLPGQSPGDREQWARHRLRPE